MLQDVTLQRIDASNSVALWRRLLRWAQPLAELGCLFATILGSFNLSRWFFSDSLGGDHFPGGLAASAVLLFGVIGRARDLYADDRAQFRSKTPRALQTWLIAFVCWVSTMLLLKPALPPYLVSYVLVFASGSIVIAATRQLPGLMDPAILRDRRILLVTQAGNLLRSASPAMPRCRVVGLVTISDPPGSPAFLEATKTAAERAQLVRADEIVLLVGCGETVLIEAVADQLRSLPWPIRLTYLENGTDAIPMASAPLDSGRTRERQKMPLGPARSRAKRAIDLVAASLIAILILPVMAGIAVLIRLDSPGPVLFRQRRIGLNGRLFHIYKFRTMTTLDDGALIRQVQPGDRRVTRLGAILRHFSLDELPQLFNVLKGDMSLVGPRPHALAHDIEYTAAIAAYACRHAAKPGITGWAQVNGWRGATPELSLMVKRVEHDIWYIDHWSIWLDIKILMLTPIVTATTRNAH